MATILAIESSCDETAVAIIRDGKLLSNIVSTQIEVHQKYGGVMPEIASRLHAENISIVLKEAVETANIKLEDVSASLHPRGSATWHLYDKLPYSLKFEEKKEKQGIFKKIFK